MFFYFYSKIIKHPILSYLYYYNVEQFNIINTIFLVILFLLSIYLGRKLYKLLKNCVLHILKYSRSREPQNNYNILRANTGGSFALLALLLAPANTSVSSKFNAVKAYTNAVETDKLRVVLNKLDQEQPHPSGTSRLSGFHEYLGTLDMEYTRNTYWAFHHYYRDIIMKQMKEELIG